IGFVLFLVILLGGAVLFKKMGTQKTITSEQQIINIPKFELEQKEFSDEDVLAATSPDYHYQYIDKSEIGLEYIKYSGSDDRLICFEDQNDALEWMNQNIGEVALNVWGYSRDQNRYDVLPPKKITDKSFINIGIIETAVNADGSITSYEGKISALKCSYFDTKKYDSSNNKKGVLKILINMENVKLFSEFYWRVAMEDDKILSITSKETKDFVIQQIYSVRNPLQSWSPRDPFEDVFLMSYDITADKKDGSVFIVEKIVRAIKGKELLHADIQ
ncbi:MAG: hypothetical protein V1860_02240, partial [bacterium]